VDSLLSSGCLRLGESWLSGIKQNCGSAIAGAVFKVFGADNFFVKKEYRINDPGGIFFGSYPAIFFSMARMACMVCAAVRVVCTIITLFKKSGCFVLPQARFGKCPTIFLYRQSVW